MNNEILLALLAGVVTIGGPCILPLLPVVLGTGVASRHPLRPAAIVGGFVLAWSAAALLFASAGTLLGISPDAWRNVAATLIMVFGALMLFPKAQAVVFARLEPALSRLQPRGAAPKNDLASGFLLGLSLGAVWTPCAGPVLGSVLTLIAGQQDIGRAVPLIVAYALGAGLPMLAIAYGGQYAVRRVHGLSAYAPVIQRVFGALVVLAGVVLLTGADLRLQRYFAGIGVTAQPADISPILPGAASSLPVLAAARPPFIGISRWWNTPGNRALIDADLNGKVVLVDFWTYSCINCIRTQPVLKAWWAAYEGDGLVIVGVHTPEFAFEKDPNNVGRAIAEAGLTYPIALDPDYATWNAYHNRYWPAEYLFDRQGRLRYTHFGEGNYAESEAAIRALLAEGGMVPQAATGADTTPAFGAIATPETYFGYARQDSFVNAAEMVMDAPHDYRLASVGPNQWSVGGTWAVGAEAMTAVSIGQFRTNFTANAVHLVLGSPAPADLVVTIDGHPPADAEMSPDMTRRADGSAIVTVSEQKLYTVAVESGGGTHQLDLAVPAGVQFYAATFGQ